MITIHSDTATIYTEDRKVVELYDVDLKIRDKVYNVDIIGQSEPTLVKGFSLFELFSYITEDDLKEFYNNFYSQNVDYKYLYIVLDEFVFKLENWYNENIKSNHVTTWMSMVDYEIQCNDYTTIDYIKVNFKDCTKKIKAKDYLELIDIGCGDITYDEFNEILLARRL